MAVTVAQTRAFLARRQLAREAAIRQRTARLMAGLPAAAALLRAEFGAEKVWLFGSLAGGRPHAESDVDLAVDAVSAGGYFTAIDRLSQALGCEVDLVDMRTASTSIRDRVLQTGVAL